MDPTHRHDTRHLIPHRHAKGLCNFPEALELADVQAFSDCPDANARYTIFDDEWFDSGWQVLSLTGDRGTE